jgi:hypothetical protein
VDDDNCYATDLKLLQKQNDDFLRFFFLPFPPSTTKPRDNSLSGTPLSPAPTTTSARGSRRAWTPAIRYLEAKEGVSSESKESVSGGDRSARVKEDAERWTDDEGVALECQSVERDHFEAKVDAFPEDLADFSTAIVIVARQHSIPVVEQAREGEPHLLGPTAALHSSLSSSPSAVFFSPTTPRRISTAASRSRTRAASSSECETNASRAREREGEGRGEAVEEEAVEVGRAVVSVMVVDEGL